MGVVLAWNRKHKRGTEPKRLNDPGPASVPATTTDVAAVGAAEPPPILLPPIALANTPTAVEYFTKLFRAYVTLGKQAGIDLTVPVVRQDFVFGLHCIQAALARQAQQRHPLHDVLDGNQLNLHVPKYIQEHTPADDDDQPSRDHKGL
jgi:hypothetical protein